MVIQWAARHLVRITARGDERHIPRWIIITTTTVGKKVGIHAARRTAGNDFKFEILST